MAGPGNNISNFCSRCKGKEESTDHKDIMLKTLDDLVNVNSLFTVAVFIGLTVKFPDMINNGIRPECQADPRLGAKAIVFEILSFACFLFSSLLAKSLKIYLNMFHTNYPRGAIIKPIRGLTFFLSIVGSVVGVVLLLVSLTFLLEIKVGKLHCHEAHVALLPSGVIVVVSLIVYAVSMAFAILYCTVF